MNTPPRPAGPDIAPRASIGNSTDDELKDWLRTNARFRMNEISGIAEMQPVHKNPLDFYLGKKTLSGATLLPNINGGWLSVPKTLFFMELHDRIEAAWCRYKSALPGWVNFWPEPTFPDRHQYALDPVDTLRAIYSIAGARPFNPVKHNISKFRLGGESVAAATTFLTEMAGIEEISANILVWAASLIFRASVSTRQQPTCILALTHPNREVALRFLDWFKAPFKHQNIIITDNWDPRPENARNPQTTSTLWVNTNPEPADPADYPKLLTRLQRPGNIGTGKQVSENGRFNKSLMIAVPDFPRFIKSTVGLPMWMPVDLSGLDEFVLDENSGALFWANATANCFYSPDDIFPAYPKGLSYFEVLDRNKRFCF